MNNRKYPALNTSVDKKPITLRSISNPIAILDLYKIGIRWLLLLLNLATFPTWAQTYSGNPILVGEWADPHVIVANGKYYTYPTADYSTTGAGRQFHAFSSIDLSSWVDEGVIFDIGPQCSWADNNGWAPSVIYRNNKYYFYYLLN